MRREACVLLLVSLLFATACSSRVELDAPGADDRLIPHAARVEMAERVLRAHHEDRMRYMAVTHRLRVAGAEACQPHVSPRMATFDESRERFERDAVLLEAATKVFALGEEPTLAGILPGGPMERAGAKPGDRLVKVAGSELGEKSVSALLVEQANETPDPIAIEVLRGESTIELRLEQVAGCRGGDTLRWSAGLCAWGGTTRISRKPERWSYRVYTCSALMRLAKSDDELAALVAHMLAHQILETTGDPEQARRHRSVQLMSARRERELLADEMSLELLAKAGYEVAAAPVIWERLALERYWLIEPGKERYGRGRIQPGFDHTWVGERLTPMREHVARLKAESSQEPGAVAGPP